MLKNVNIKMFYGNGNMIWHNNLGVTVLYLTGWHWLHWRLLNPKTNRYMEVTYIKNTTELKMF